MRFIEKINDLPLKYKFILFYVMGVLIPIVSVNLVFLSKISVFVTEREMKNSRIAMERARTDLVGVVQGCVAVSHLIATDTQLSQALVRKYADFNQYFDSYISYLRDRLDRYVVIYDCIGKIRLYTTNRTVFGSGYYLLIDSEVKSKGWYQALIRTDNIISLHAYKEKLLSDPTGSDQYLCLVRKMDEVAPAGGIHNYIKIDLAINKIFEIFNREQNYISVCLVAPDNRMIYAPNNRFFYHLAPKGRYYRRTLFDKRAAVFEYQLGNANYFHGWKLVGVVNSQSVAKALNRSRYFILCLALVSMLVASLLILLIVRSYNTRIRRLAKQMVKVENQQFEPLEIVEGKDEIGGLIRSFNLMAAKINALINDVYKLKLQKKELELERVRAELNFLQSQMNPHFLFNTLNAILVVCVKNHYHTEICDVIKYLAKTLRRLFSWKDDLVTVAEELTFSEMYLKIEKFRFGEKFQYELIVDEKALCCKIPKLSIQPLIENACKHGLQTIKGDGLVRVQVTLTEDLLRVSVKDNGSGIDEVKLRELVFAINNEHVSNNGIGIRNVYRRLKLYYGKMAQFDITSRINAGTEVSFAVPARQQDLKAKEADALHVQGNIGG
jgi:two-component system sensor histidine kinase YesM